MARFKRVLVANRGEVAIRIARAATGRDVVAKIEVAELRRQIEERLARQVPEPFARGESA